MSDTSVVESEVTEQPAEEAKAEAPEFSFDAVPENWKDFLPEDVREDGSLAPIKNIPELAKSYANAQQLIGRDKLPIPKTPEEFAAHLKKLGAPEDAKGYKFADVELPEGYSNMTDQFAEKAAEVGLLPQQAQELHKWWTGMTGEQFEAASLEQKNQLEEAETSLKKEWGMAYEQNLEAGKRFINNIGDDDFANFVNETGLGNNPTFIKFAVKAAQALSEDSDFASDGKSVLSPGDAKREMNNLMFDVEFQAAYFDGKHPGHKTAVDKMSTLQKAASAG